MKPYYHAKSSAAKHGGKWEDYIAIHDFMDSSKAHLSDWRHRAIFHSTLGCFIVEKVFGTILVNSEGKSVCTRDIAEQHCIEDLGIIPSVEQWLRNMRLEPWMGGKRSKDKREGKNNRKNIPMSDVEKLAIPLPKGFAPDTSPAIGDILQPVKNATLNAEIEDQRPDWSKVMIDGNRPSISSRKVAKLYD